MFKNKKISIAIVMVLVFTLIAAGCSQQSQGNEVPENKPSDEPGKKFLSIATGKMSGTYYSLGNSLASLYNERIEGNINFSAESTSGSAQKVTWDWLITMLQK